MYGLVLCPQGCRCGYLTDPRKECHCAPRQVRNYLSKISGPLLDRIDIHARQLLADAAERVVGAQGAEAMTELMRPAAR